MRFEFYTIEAGTSGSVQLRLLESTGLDDATDSAVQAVNAQFKGLVDSNPDIGPIVVVASNFGDPPGVIVATEYIHALPRESFERQGQPFRSLEWVTHPSTGLHAR